MSGRADRVALAGRPDRPIGACLSPLLGAPVVFPVDSPVPLTSLHADDMLSHIARFGSRPLTSGAAGRALVDTLDGIGLRGRGGGHFPAAAKWRAHLAAGGSGVVVANGAESEPASAKDAALICLRPHLILDGLACAAEALNARDVVIWLHHGDHAGRSTLLQALNERRGAGLSDPPMRIVIGPDHYLSGESSAIVNALSGGPALPMFRTTPTAVSGAAGRPTLIHNVETLARVALAARTGAAQHRPTTLLTVADERARVVVEVDPRATIGAVLQATGWTPVRHRPEAILVGGYGGAWLRWPLAEGLSASEQGLSRQGISLGAGVILPLARDACGVFALAELAEFLAASSARQCGPCLFGLRAIADALAELDHFDTKRRGVVRLRRYLDEVVGRGACHHPDGAAQMIASGLAAFAVDVKAHLHGRCLARRPGGFFRAPKAG
jgi:NADH:ubiquinone oxidoreductase subunit F (NADH-binding)